jgi:hypothetical protein
MLNIYIIQAQFVGVGVCSNLQPAMQAIEEFNSGYVRIEWSCRSQLIYNGLSNSDVLLRLEWNRAPNAVRIIVSAHTSLFVFVESVNRRPLDSIVEIKASLS